MSNPTGSSGIKSIVRIGILCCLMVLPIFVSAEQGGALHWESLSETQRQVLRPMQKDWPKIGVEMQHRLAKGAARWSEMSATQRQNARTRMQRWNTLSDTQKAVIRDRYRRFKALPLDEQERARQLRRWFKSLPEGKQADLKEKWQNMTPAERGAFKQRVRERLRKLTPEQRHRLRQMGPEQRRRAIQRWRERRGR